MIAVRLEGGLGNQLFQYAFAAAAGRELGVSYCVDSRTVGTDKVRRYFRPRLIPAVVEYVRSRIFCGLLCNVTIEQNGTQPPADVLNRLVDRAVYRGFFQSEEYSASIRQHVKRMFRIKQTYQNEFKRLYGNLYDTSRILAIHLRLTDYAEYGGSFVGGKNLCLPTSYYDNVLRLVPNLELYRIVVVSDDPHEARERLSGVEIAVCKAHSEAMDFQLLQNANLICVANSTFSWWAAYLRKDQLATVFAPQHWLGFKVGREYPVAIVPSKWTQVAVGR